MVGPRETRILVLSLKILEENSAGQGDRSHVIGAMRPLDHDGMKSEMTMPMFSDTLRRFHEQLFTFPWEKQFPGLVFIRDYEALPVRAPFDVDLMAPTAIWEKLDSVFAELVHDLGLVMTSRRSAHSFLILIFDPDISAKQLERTWVYFEIRDEIVVTPALTITSHDVIIDYTSGIPVPSHFWRFFLTLVQSVRKNDLEALRPVLMKLAEYDPDVINKTAELLKVRNSDVREGLSSAVSSVAMRKRLGIAAKPLKMPLATSWKTSLKYYVEERLFFLHLSKPFLYTLHGADGVGKSTVSEILKKVFEGYPLSFETFHHVTGWKHAGSKEDEQLIRRTVEQRTIPILSKPLWRRGVSYIYRFLPESLRNIWVLSSGYVKYCTNLDGTIIRHDRKGFVMLADRYLHDMWVKNRLAKNGPNLLHRLYARALRKPRLAILLVDEPERVFERKQELSVEQITTYQLDLEDALKSTGVRYVRIPVNGRSVQEVAREIAATLLNDIGPAAINLMRAHVQKMITTMPS